MSKYKVGDRVVLRNDLKDSEWYGANTWTDLMRGLLGLPYVSIIDSSREGFVIEESTYKITNEMIQGLYKEDKKMNIKAGDKVVIRKDLVVEENSIWGRGISKLMDCDYAVVNYVTTEGVGVAMLSDPEVSWVVTDEMIEGLHEEPKKYVWYLDDGETTYFLNNLLGVFRWYSDETKEIKNGENDAYLLTEEEARQSPFFDKFTKHDPFEEKWYYIRMKGNQKDYLNLNINDGEYFMDDNDEYVPFKATFTEEECNEIIGTSSILYKELVNEK